LTPIGLLRQIQALDTRIDANHDRVATIEAIVSDRSEYESARRDNQVHSAALKKLEGEQRDLDLQENTIRQQLADGEQRLYSGQIRSPRELEDLKKKGDDQRRQVSTMDEQMLNLLEAIETESTAASAAETRLRDIVAGRRTLETELLAERKTLAAQIRADVAERDGLRAQVERPTMRLYDRLRETQGGLAVTEVRQRICQGCRVTLTAAAEQRLRQGGTLITCQNCVRILFPGD